MKVEHVGKDGNLITRERLLLENETNNQLKEAYVEALKVRESVMDILMDAQKLNEISGDNTNTGGNL